MAIRTAKSTTCCPGPIPPRKPSKTWPENSDYAGSAPWVIVSLVDIPARSIAITASDGSSSTSASTTLRVSPSSRSWPTSAKQSAIAFLEAAVAYYAKLGGRIERVMTDNGSCYRSKLFRAACKRLGLRQIFTKPYTPKTDGKAERFIQTALREWAYARAYHNSDQRSDELIHWLHHYNWHRPHGSLKANTPISRLGLSEDNLLRLHS